MVELCSGWFAHVIWIIRDLGSPADSSITDRVMIKRKRREGEGADGLACFIFIFESLLVHEICRERSCVNDEVESIKR